MDGDGGAAEGVVIGGTASGVGKTVATLAVGRALEEAGRTVAPAKAGPDYIDPSHHAATFGRPSRTLDTWMAGVDGVRRNYRRGEGDVAVVEGMMGLYDGSATSTAATAAALDLPVVLVVDAAAGMESVAATALGFREYAARADLPAAVRAATDEPRVEVAGVIAARARGGRHEDGIREALPDDLDYFGRIPPLDGLEIPDRHLGLRMGDEAAVDGEALATAAGTVDAEALLAAARSPPPAFEPSREPAAGAAADGPAVTVAVASDDAFRFVYPATRERLGRLADVEPFAPAAGDDLPDCDAVYLPGGYPELHAAALASGPALETVAAHAAEGLPVYGECGGAMVLTEALTTGDGDRHRMAGVLPGEVRMCDRYRALDHVELRALDDGPTAAAGERHRGHEFHYSTHGGATDARYAFAVERGEGMTGDRDGLTEHRTVGTYAHRHAASGAFDRLVAAADRA